jgi:hypothetical protein
MSSSQYDAIVVGARCAVSPTAMLLAARGHNHLPVRVVYAAVSRTDQPLGAIASDQESMDGFARMFGGVTSPAEFYSEGNVQQIFARAAAT